MKAFNPPPVRSGKWLGATLECHELAGILVWSVTVKGRSGPARRRWYAEEAHAFAYALDQSESRQLPFFDMREGCEA